MMEANFQRELNAVIQIVRKIGPEMEKGAKEDLKEAAALMAASLKLATPISKAPHKVRGKVYTQGTSRRSMRVLPLRRTKSAAIVGPSFRSQNPPFYIRFVEKGTRNITARRFIENTRERVGPVAQSLAIRLIIQRIVKFERENLR